MSMHNLNANPNSHEAVNYMLDILEIPRLKHLLLKERSARPTLSPDIDATATQALGPEGARGIGWPTRAMPYDDSVAGGVTSYEIHCFVFLDQALGFECCTQEEPGEEYTFAYDSYVPGGSMQFKHRMNPDTPITRIMKLVAIDYLSIASTQGLEHHYYETLAIEGITIDHEAKTVSFDIGS